MTKSPPVPVPDDFAETHPATATLLKHQPAFQATIKRLEQETERLLAALRAEKEEKP